MNLKIKNKSGITLVALIITIVVMLILVAVSINILVNSNLIGHAEKTGDAYAGAIKNEENLGNDGITINGEKYATIDDYINHNPMTTIKMNMEVTYRDTDIPTDETKYTLTNENVPIPAGYYYVGGTKDTGVVISDNANDKDKGDDHSVSATLQGNQFVWVPVLQNQKIKIEIVAEDTITSVELLDPTGTAITTPAPTDKTYTESVEPTRNGVYKLTVKTANETKEGLLYVSTLYAQDAFVTKEMFRNQVQQMMQQENKTEAEILATLPGVGENQTIDTAYPIFVNMLASQFIDNANTPEATVTLYKNSVNKYGGFYIARYEAGCDNIRKTGDSIENVTVYSQANKHPYNYIKQTSCIKKAKEIASGKVSVTAGLINGAAWDRTLNWILETNNNMSLADINENSTSWGNYYNSKFNFTGKYSTNKGTNFTDVTTSTGKPDNKSYLLGTGVTDYTKKNNIYDLAGNCYEWTTESDSSDDRVGRGRRLPPQWFWRSSEHSLLRFIRRQPQLRPFFPSHTLCITVRKAGDTVIKYPEVVLGKATSKLSEGKLFSWAVTKKIICPLAWRQ